MNKIEAAKFVTNLIVGAGVTKITSDIIKNNVQPENIKDQVTVFAGSFVLGSMAVKASKDYTSSQIDAIVEFFRKLKNRNQEETAQEAV